MTMAMETYTSKYPDEVRTDVLFNARQTCYKARDAFYACLEKESHSKATEIAAVGLLYPVDCKKSRQVYEKVCRRTWVTHFDRQYCAKKRAQRLLDDNESRRGPISLPQKSTDRCLYWSVDYYDALKRKGSRAKEKTSNFPDFYMFAFSK
ncbi:hypothetical protein M8C21_001055 [Ambrosia artemisiifolia]|uniref:Uncharacterized protein n=1 Tax=Ambrosia artemisiifolia TaxID=4212 RepID=A0AAD5BS26_AMBAR|nr:hypothetical protein M8C21_001046 [Ambrosia artemisiifolia]KAI7728537.1 hypothetical protein M8C21_001055 [Ambrosia artemisiifolia]